jgi:aldoxime dehydratase
MVFHVEYPRVIPERKPAGHEPRAPRYTLRWNDPVETMVSEYYGMQEHELTWEEQSRFFERVKTSFAHPDGPDAHEIMRFTDDAGEVNAVVVSYWLDATRHSRWSLAADFPRWFSAPERCNDGQAGYWRETIAVAYDRHETLYSAPSYRIGLGRTPGSTIETSTTNGYFGAARDRIPISAIDPLDSPLMASPPKARAVNSRGRRLRVATPHNMTAIRSGQFWARAGAEQLDDYQENLRPKLMRGMDHLVRHREETGTLSLRIMTNIDEDGTERRETSVLAYLLSLGQLEAWAKSHETHLDIYRHAIAMNRKYQEKREVVTWHEVFILPAATGFEYVNCHSKTGVLPYFELLEPRLV